MIGVTVHLLIGSINWPNNVSSWSDAAQRRSRFLRVSPNITAIRLIAGEAKGSATLPGDLPLPPPMTLNQLGKSVSRDGSYTYSSDMTGTG